MLQQQKRAAPNLLMSLTQAREIRMEVVFGTPSQNCIGSGVCMVMHRLPVHQTLRCPHAPALISFERGRLIFRFSKSEVIREDALSRFGSRWFEVQESFQMPRYAARHLGLPSLWVLPGLYTIEETGNDWLLAFSLHP